MADPTIQTPALTRRRFLRWGALSAIAWSAAACGYYPMPADTLPTEATTPAGALVTPTRPPKILRNENRVGFYIRYFEPFPAVDPAAWRLEVKGLVDKPRSFTLDELLALERIPVEARMKCVECWSARAFWEGFTYSTLAGLVQPQPEASHLRLDCADGYWEIVSIEEMSRPRALFVTHMNREQLPDEYGAPLRIMLPWKYGYKSAKAITSIEFTDAGGKGYWSTVGPYTEAGEIEEGFDHPLDLGGKSRPILGGEITDY